MEDPGQEVPPELLRGEQAGGRAQGSRHRGRALWTQVGAGIYGRNQSGCEKAKKVGCLPYIL